MNSRQRTKRAPLSPMQPSNRRRPSQIPGAIGRGGNRVPPSSILVKKSRSKSRPRRPPSPTRSASTTDARDGRDSRAHKAEAYEARVMLASQEQRVADLQAELEEIKGFQALEFEGQREKGRGDAALAEALAWEVETLEEALKSAQKSNAEASQAQAVERAQWERTRAELLEGQQRELSAAERGATIAAQSVEAKWERRMAEVQDTLERQRRELREAKEGTEAGIAIMKDLDAALKKVRAERDEARFELAATRLSTERCREQAAGKEELEGTLASARTEHDEARDALRALTEEVRALRPKCDILARSNEDLQRDLAEAQNEVGEKMEALELARAEAQAQEQRQTSALGDLAARCEVQREDLSDKAAVIEELEGKVEEMRAESTRVVDDLEVWRERKRKMQARDDERWAEIAVLEAEKAELSDGLQREVISREAQEELADAVKSDFAAAVKENQDKKEEIRALAREVRTQRSQLKSLAKRLQKRTTERASAPKEAPSAEAARLARELASVRREHAQSRAQARDLQDALRAAEAALTTVSSRVLSSPRQSPRQDRDDGDEARRRVEDDALREYCTHRLGE